MVQPTVLLGLLPSELADRLESDERARLVSRVLARGDDPYTSPDVFPGVQRRLEATTAPTRFEIVEAHEAPDGTQKTLLEFGAADRRVETVVIPTERRSTLCVSSQVGCKRACHFCLTATMGLTNNLTAEEIIAQYYAALVRGHRPRNIVFMGMGEPLDNFEAVKRAVEILVHPRAFAVAPRHVTVSTVAPSPNAVLGLKTLPVRFAWSLHAANDTVRRQLIGTHRHQVTALRDAFAEVCTTKHTPLFVEVTMIDGVNDRPEHANDIIALFADFPAEVRFNLLPMNPIGNALAPSPDERVDAFGARLRRAGYFTMVRRARGDDTRAACGQLYAAGVSKRLKVV